MNIENQLEELTGALALDIDSRTYNTSPWLNLVEKSSWPDGIGHTFETLKFERTQPDAEQTWQTHATADGTGNICNPPSTTLGFKLSRNQVVMRSTSIKTKHFCVEDMRAKYQFDEQVELATQMLAKNISNVWIEYYRDNYVAVANKKIVLDDNFSETNQAAGDAFNLAPATSKLTNGFLDVMYEFLNIEGAAMYAHSQQGGRPLYMLVTSSQTSRSLIKSDPAIREDFRSSNESDTLLQGLGYQHTYNGFFHAVDPTPRRFNWDGGGTQWVRVPAWTVAGDVVVQNPDYANATHEDTIIFVNNVYEALVPGTISKIKDMEYGAQNYIGEIEWVNIKNETDNIRGKNGFFYAEMQSAVRARNTEFGIVVRHLRCFEDALELAACSV